MSTEFEERLQEDLDRSDAVIGALNDVISAYSELRDAVSYTQALQLNYKQALDIGVGVIPLLNLASDIFTSKIKIENATKHLVSVQEIVSKRLDNFNK